MSELWCEPDLDVARLHGRVHLDHVRLPRDARCADMPALIGVCRDARIRDARHGLEAGRKDGASVVSEFREHRVDVPWRVHFDIVVPDRHCVVLGDGVVRQVPLQVGELGVLACVLYVSLFLGYPGSRRAGPRANKDGRPHA